jgi:hypothetical protein
VSNCHYCNAVIRWVHLDTGSNIPVEPIQTERGNVAAAATSGGQLQGYVVSAAKPLRAEFDTFMPHKARCRPERGRIAAEDRPMSLFDISEDS